MTSTDEVHDLYMYMKIYNVIVSPASTLYCVDSFLDIAVVLPYTMFWQGQRTSHSPNHFVKGILIILTFWIPIFYMYLPTKISKLINCFKAIFIHFTILRILQPFVGGIHYLDINVPLILFMTESCNFLLSTREHDKGPDLFFHTLYQLADQGLQFKVSVLGERFSEVPGEFFPENCTYLIEFIH